MRLNHANFPYALSSRIPIFAKGANWIPADSFPSRITREKYARLVRDAAAANMNMLRVWGGGIYESDKFYDLCDELGILVWQDFMFACCAYPATPEFLRNIREEMKHQMRRLKSHACLALWCGNNENEGVWKWWSRSKAHEKLVKRDYKRLQTEIARTCAIEDPGRPFTPASPFPGGNESVGDEHFWWVGGRREPFSEHLKLRPRFVSEFGFQSFPNIRTLRKAAGGKDLNLSSPAVEHHQRKKGWNGLLMDYICSNFRMPATPDRICYLSQLNQALAMKTAVEHWRRCRPRTMGALYWQFNDCWPAVSWAGIDSGLKWKALHYFARRFFSPLLVSLVEHGDALETWICSDLPRPVEGTITTQLWRTDGKLLDSISIPFKAKPHESRKISRIKCSVGTNGMEVRLATDIPALFVRLDCGSPGPHFSDNYFSLFPGIPMRVKLETGKGKLLKGIASTSLAEA